MPLSIFIASRLAALFRDLGPGAPSLMIDAPVQLLALPLFPPRIFLKLDTGYYRAGPPPDSAASVTLIDATLTAESLRPVRSVHARQP